ncbi:unnamed protein product, partial [Candidula unifasciata]
FPLKEGNSRDQSMDVVRNFKSLSFGQFCGLQILEFVYLMVLAFLPFLLAFKESVYLMLCILAVVGTVAFVRFCSSQLVNTAGKVILITGCDSGFGNACARQLVSQGFTVIAGCYNIGCDGALALKEIVTDNLHIVKLDITNEEDVQKVVMKIRNLNHDRGLWALVNNAGVGTFGDIELLSLDTYKDVLNVNLMGTLRVTKACLPLIRAAKGRVVTVTGSTGKLSLPGQSALCISDFGLEAFNDALRLEMQRFQVKVITIRPGNFLGATGMLNKSGLEKLRLHFDLVTQRADQEILRAYGQNYLNKQYNQLQKLSKQTAGSLISVVDAVEAAVKSRHPNTQVLVDGGNQLIDIGNILVRLQPFLPCFLHDFLVARLYRPNIGHTNNKT